MAKVAIIVGGTCSGKTTLIDFLQTDRDFRRIITSTSRPIREGETDGVHYHFLDKSVFEQYPERFVEINSYNGHYYGLQLRGDLDQNKINVVILDINGANALQQSIPQHQSQIFFVQSTLEMRIQRLFSRHQSRIEKEVSHDVCSLMASNDAYDLQHCYERSIKSCMKTAFDEFQQRVMTTMREEHWFNPTKHISVFQDVDEAAKIIKRYFEIEPWLR